MSGSLNRFTTDYRVKSGPHPWSEPYTPKCIRKGCKAKPLHKENIHYSCCENCLRELGLGPFKKLTTKLDSYSSLFWSKDVENKLNNKRKAQ